MKQEGVLLGFSFPRAQRGGINGTSESALGGWTEGLLKKPR